MPLCDAASPKKQVEFAISTGYSFRFMIWFNLLSATNTLFFFLNIKQQREAALDSQTNQISTDNIEGDESKEEDDQDDDEVEDDFQQQTDLQDQAKSLLESFMDISSPNLKTPKQKGKKRVRKN